VFWTVSACPPDVKALAYTSLIRPHLEFASVAWDPYTVSNTNCLDKVQCRAAWFVKNDYRYSTSVSHLVSDLGWQSLTQRRKNARLQQLDCLACPVRQCTALLEHEEVARHLPYGR